jgi:hypothetical protein
MNTSVLKRFISRVRTANQANTADVRIPVSEANEIANCIAELLVEVLEKRAETKAEEPTTVEIKLDGGSITK